MNIWQKLKEKAVRENSHISVLAPMYDVTNYPFREVVAQTCKPDVMFTEFVNCDGLVSEKGRKHFIQMLKFSELQRPIIAQIWGNNPETYETAAKMLADMGVDGIDINMGCPQEKELKIGACAALIEDNELAERIIKATLKGTQNRLAVSVKTRTGIKSHTTKDWISFLLQFELSAITLHGRTVAQMSKVPANWDEIALAVEVRDTQKKETLIIGNGDVRDNVDGEEKCINYGTDGYMIGRGIFKNIWCFNKVMEPKDSIQREAELKRLHELHKRIYQNETGKPLTVRFDKVYKWNHGIGNCINSLHKS